MLLWWIFIIRKVWRANVLALLFIALAVVHLFSTSEKLFQLHQIDMQLDKIEQTINHTHIERGFAKTTFKKPQNPRKMSSTWNPIYFVHIGKTGGTSMDKLMLKLLKEQRQQPQLLLKQQQQHTVAKFRKYYGMQHYDWSFIQHEQQIRQKRGIQSGNGNKYITVADGDDDEYDVSFNADVITFLRDPVKRAVSQFYFSQTTRWARNIKPKPPFVDMTFEEYMVDPFHAGFEDPVRDGLGGVAYLAGISSSNWIGSDGTENLMLKASLRGNKTASCLRAARRLDQTMWFGLLEDVDRSMKLLQITMDLDSQPVLSKSNVAPQRGRNVSLSNEVISSLEGYLPQDIWLYKYAKQLFEARWNYFTSNDGADYVRPDFPALPQFND